jgi:phosphoesterase RecJ-like protein
MDNSTLTDIRKEIERAKSVAVVSHIRPDGDAVGSILSLGLALERDGKTVQMVLEDGIPERFTFLAGAEKITRQITAPFDLLVVVDCSEIDRIGNVVQDGRIPDINIDHHITNTYFGRFNFVDRKAAATVEIIGNHHLDLGLELTPSVVDALMTGLITDTIGFRTNNMRSETMRLAAQLMDLGANLPVLYQNALADRKFNAMRYWGAGLSSLDSDDGMVWATLTLEDRKKANYHGKDDADLINILSSVKEANIAMIFIEQNGGSVKISWRSKNGYDVSGVAMKFGGGGHKAAAGAEIQGELGDVKDRVLTQTRILLKEK